MNIDEIKSALNKIQSEWELDSKIRDTELDTDSLRTPQLHSKYMKFLTEFSFVKKKLDLQMKILKRKKFQYYSKKDSPEVYIENPLPVVLLKSEVNIYVDSDDDVCKLQLKIDSIEVIINYIDSIIKQITNRTFQIKNAIEYKKYINGIN